MNKTIRRAALILLAVPTLAFAAKSDEPSAISAYAGKYSGTVTLIQSFSPTPVVGTAQGTFNASKKKESGTLSLTSIVSQGGTTLVVGETYTIRKRALTYLLSAPPTAAPGFGNVSVGKKQISYTAFVTISGSDTALVIGKITLKKNRLVVNEVISTGTGSLNFIYSLKKKGGKK